MFTKKQFTFDRKCDIPNALHSLRTDSSTDFVGATQTKHLEPIIDASKSSTGRMGRLNEKDLRKLQGLGSCNHTELLVLLLEPTRESDSTIVWIDSFLQSTTGGLLNRENTAILNCRALVPNASYTKGYTDCHP